MAIDLSNRVVAITGASSGIGEATALACARAGAAVALAARRPIASRRSPSASCRRVAERLRCPPTWARRTQARAFVERAHAELGRLDVLVNNAGVMLLGPIENAPHRGMAAHDPRERVRRALLHHAALPLMRAQGSGHIVNVSSVAGRVARAGSGVYNLTKFGVGAFSESLRQEAVGLGVRVTLVEPGAVATELAGHNRPEVLEQMAKRFQGVTPLAAEDIANAVLYAIGQPPNVSVNEVLIRPSGQMG